MTTFNVGDRVRVYEGCERSGSGIGVVISIDVFDGELWVKGDYLDDYFHPKQCRKLVKKRKINQISAKEAAEITKKIIYI